VHIKCFPQDVVGKTGEISLSFDTNNAFTTSATMFQPVHSEDNYLKVPCTSLQALKDKTTLKNATC
jgi:hypothetical protein